MTDRVLTEKEVGELANLNEHIINGLGRADARVLITSHRLLQQLLTLREAVDDFERGPRKETPLRLLDSLESVRRMEVLER